MGKYRRTAGTYGYARVPVAGAHGVYNTGDSFLEICPRRI